MNRTALSSEMVGKRAGDVPSDDRAPVGIPANSVCDRMVMDRFFRDRRWDPYYLKRFRYALFVEGRRDADALGMLPHDIRETVSRRFNIHALSGPDVVSSEADESEKALFSCRPSDALHAENYSFETVLVRGLGRRRTLCVSSQVGCAASCRFCATGQMGLRRQLSTNEILDQVLRFRQRLRETGEHLRNVVFMGMGEPLHNELAVYGALELLQDARMFGFSPRRIMVSTVGIPDAMRRFSRRFPKTSLALSLHPADQDQRADLIPWAKTTHLNELRSVLTEIVATGRTVMIEYLMLNRVNDSPEHAKLLAKFLEDLRVHINLIPFNPIDGVPWTSSPREVRDRFATLLRKRGFVVTIRYSQGHDIAAACGQLVTGAGR